ncbi:hypothetical protein EDM68_02700 [Candidatus Uhrbacteria bacterium]|nr:MAG: hypothetical protein EDM68_02700 [Candidatus Uhrbacteria bacterium]
MSPRAEEVSEKKRNKAFLFLLGLPIIPLLGLAAWQGAGLPTDPAEIQERLSLVQEAQAATVRVDETLKKINELLGVDSFTDLSVQERAELMQSVSAEDQARLTELLGELQIVTQTATALTEQASTSSETTESGTTGEAATVASELSALLASAEETLTAIQEAAPEGSELASATDETLAMTEEAQAALDALLEDLAQQLVDAGMTQEEAAALVGEIGEQMTNAWQHASEEGREGLLNAMEAQARQETNKPAPSETAKPRVPGRP